MCKLFIGRKDYEDQFLNENRQVEVNELKLGLGLLQYYDEIKQTWKGEHSNRDIGVNIQKSERGEVRQIRDQVGLTLRIWRYCISIKRVEVEEVVEVEDWTCNKSLKRD